MANKEPGITKINVKKIYKDENAKEIKDIILNSYILFVRKEVLKS